jgi:hypothetical protein
MQNRRNNMRALRWLQPLAVLALLAGALPDVAAQDKVPAKMSGKWSGTTPAKGTPFGGSWSIVVDKQGPDGSVEGKVTWEGRTCGMDDEPFTGSFDGTQLTIVAQFRDKFPNANCPKSRLVLQKKGTSDFEGTIPGSQMNYRLTLGAS